MFVARVSQRKLHPSLLLTSGGCVGGRPRPPEPGPSCSPSPGLSPPGCGEEDTACPERPESGQKGTGQREEKEKKGTEWRRRCGGRKETRAAQDLDTMLITVTRVSVFTSAA